MSCDEIVYNSKKDISDARSMKYRDLITLFVSLSFVLSLAYVAGVAPSLWFVPVIFLVVLVLVVWKLWLEKD